MVWSAGPHAAARKTAERENGTVTEQENRLNALANSRGIRRANLLPFHKILGRTP